MATRSEIYALLVCGGRDFADREYLYFVLDTYLFRYGDVMIIHGSARGADTLAEWWAKDRQQLYCGFPAEWKKYGKRAGMKRNSEMAVLSGCQEIAAFYGGRGTQGMVNLARSLDIPVTLWGWSL